MNPILQAVLLLFASNIFMTAAWYGHLKWFHDKPLLPVILIAWGIAFFEYIFQVPANRLGATVLSGYQLKIVQEIVTLIVFAVFARVLLNETMRWNHLAAFACLAGAAFFAFYFKSD